MPIHGEIHSLLGLPLVNIALISSNFAQDLIQSTMCRV